MTKNGNIITCAKDNFVPLVVPGLSSSSSSCSAPTSRTKGQSSSSGESEKPSDSVTTRSDKPACGRSMQTDPEKPASGNRGSANKDEMDKEDPTQGIPDWLQPFKDNLKDLEAHVPAHSSEREDSNSEAPAKMVTNRKHSIYTHFPKDRNCYVCLRTKIARVPCRKRDEGSIPRVVQFGDLTTADHKVLSEGSESRSNHRYAVVVHDLDTQWIQSYPCKTKTSQETEKSPRKFLEPSQKPQVIYTDYSLGFGKSCKGLSWHHRTSTPHRFETNGLAERAVRRVKEGASAVLLQSGLDEQWWSDSMECYCYLRNVQDLLADGKTPYERGNDSKDQLSHSVHKWNIPHTPRETKRESINSERKSYQEFSQAML